MDGRYLPHLNHDEWFRKMIEQQIDQQAAAAPHIQANSYSIDCATRSLKALSHPLRLKILCTLCDDEISVSNITNRVGTSQSNISQHLSVLRDKGILMSRKEANQVYYRIVDMRTLKLLKLMCDVY